MARLAATAYDPSAFSSLVFGSPLHAGQRRYCANAQADVNFLLPGNSYGKTELELRDAIYRGWFKTGPNRPKNYRDWMTQPYRILVCSYNYPIAKESFIRLISGAGSYYNQRDEFRVLIQNKIETDPPFIELSNNTRIDWGSLDGSGRLVEAARYNHIYVDEAGHIPDLARVFDNILYPRTLGVGGQIHLFGTPKPHSDPLLLEIFEKGQAGDPFYYAQAGSCLENEFWPADERRRVLANPRYVTGWQDECPSGGCILDQDGKHPILTLMGRQVILGAFVLAGGFFFSRPHVSRMFTGDHDVTWVGDTQFYSQPQAGRLYMGAFDLGGNKLKRRKHKGSDPTVGFVVDYTERPWKIVWYRYIEGGELDWNQRYEVMSKVFHDYGMPYLLIDATGTVDSVQEALQDRGVEVEGIQFGGLGNKKLDMLRNLQLVMELHWGDTVGVLRSPKIDRLKHELDTYVLPDDDIVQDHVMALGMVCHHIAQFELPPPISGDVY